MTDQTPSTEDVRYGYRTGVTAPILPVEAGDAFDAWLAANNREVAANVLDDLTAWLTDMQAKHPDRTKYVPLVLLNIERFRADRIGAGDE